MYGSLMSSKLRRPVKAAYDLVLIMLVAYWQGALSDRELQRTAMANAAAPGWWTPAECVEALPCTWTPRTSAVHPAYLMQVNATLKHLIVCSHASVTPNPPLSWANPD